MQKFENCRPFTIAGAIAGALLAVVLCGLSGLKAHAQAIPFSTPAESSAATSTIDARNPLDSAGSKGSHGTHDTGASESGKSSGASQGYGHTEDSTPSTLQVEPDGNGEIGKPFARVLRVAGDIAASAPDSDELRHLKTGDMVRVGDHLQSSGGGELLLQASDASMIALRPASELWIESYAAQGKPADHMVLRLVDGGARVVSGWIPHVNPAGSQIVTTTTTIGAGDSDHETFVVSSELANSDRVRPGTYDKVNRGSTVLRAANQDLEIEVGQVGFVGAAPPSTSHAHTVLLPESLDKLPAFYARGSFDQEMDTYVKDIDHTSDAMLQAQLGNVTLSAAVCDPSRAGKAWLRSLDSALARRDASRLEPLFAPDARFTATVPDSSGALSSRDVDESGFTHDMVSIPSASNASVQRVSSTFAASPDTRRGGCAEVVVQSLVAQRGTLHGKPYRTQSAETYHLDLIDGAWLAVSAVSVRQ